ncbi:MAG: ATP-binding protein, partial [bacterium]
RYTARGGVLVGCRRCGALIALQVWDTGIGIDERQIPHVFREFYQVEDVVRVQEQGLGLGLSIVRRAADLMGARVEVHSRLGRGSVFSIVLARTQAAPALASAPAPAPAEAAADMPVSLGILLIDDQQAVLDATADLLRGRGHRVLAARTVAEALDLAVREDARVELILADFRLDSQLTGADAIREINARLQRPVPAIIITGDSSPERIQEAVSSGHLILHKPIAAEVLMAAITETSAKTGTVPASER